MIASSLTRIFLIFLSSFLFSNPESEIIVINNFIPADFANTLIQHYNSQQSQVNHYTDNQLGVDAIADESVRKIFFDIVDKVIQLIHQKYIFNDKKIGLDHGGLFCRIPPNYAPYHSDNTYFDCPIHGKDQSVLRKVCPQTCPGSRFVPNHTAWRNYTALLYLNDDFEGGEIAFEDGPCNQLYKKTIPIQAGMLILSPNGPHYYHEVFPMKKGKRYSMHLWFTSDPAHFHPRFVR